MIDGSVELRIDRHRALGLLASVIFSLLIFLVLNRLTADQFRQRAATANITSVTFYPAPIADRVLKSIDSALKQPDDKVLNRPVQPKTNRTQKPSVQTEANPVIESPINKAPNLGVTPARPTLAEPSSDDLKLPDALVIRTDVIRSVAREQKARSQIAELNGSVTKNEQLGQAIKSTALPDCLGSPESGGLLNVLLIPLAKAQGKCR